MRKTLLGYVPDNSPAYAFHPFSRIFFILTLTFIPLLNTDTGINVSLILAALALFLVSKVNLRIFKFYFFIYAVTFVFIFSVYALFPDEPMKNSVILHFGKFTLYNGAIFFALKIYLRIACILTLTVYFLHITTESEIIIAMRTVKIPFIFCYMLGLSLRAIGMFVNDWLTVREAEKARALDVSEMNILKRAAKIINYAVPLLALAIRRTDEFSDAISSRAFSLSGGSKRPNYFSSKFRFEKKDFLLMAAGIAVLVIVIYGKSC